MERIGPYELIEKIAEGGMGAIYKARQVPLNRIVALKVLPSHLENDAISVQRFRREAQTAGSIRHENIVSVFDGHVDGPPYYIAMELLEGEALRHILTQRKRLPPEEAVAIIRQVGAALDHAHSHGIIHRDVKPDNIIVDAEGKVTLTDFGIARATYDPRLTMVGTIGSPDYMSPEQVKNEPLDHRTDLYSAGVVLYEMLTGRTPFSGSGYRIVNEEPARLRDEDPSVSPGLDRAVLKMLAKDRSRRYQSGAEMAGALEANLARRPKPEKERAAGAGGVLERKRRILLSAALGVVVACIGVAVYTLIPRPNGPPPTPVSVPPLSGTTRDDAAARQRPIGLRLVDIEEQPSDAIPRGRVIASVPPEGRNVAPGSPISLVISLGPSASPGAGLVEVPSLIGKSGDQAKQALRRAGLEYEIGDKVLHAVVPRGYVTWQNPRAHSEQPAGAKVRVVLSLGPGVTVPDVVGQSWEEARAALESTGLRAVKGSSRPHDSVPRGHIASQTPGAGEERAPGSAVLAHLSIGPPVRVPQIVGLSVNQAKTELRAAGLTFHIAGKEFDASVARGYVVSQSPRAGGNHSPGARVAVVLSLGPSPSVPYLTGKSETEAVAALRQLGLRAGTKYQADPAQKGTVIAQHPRAGTRMTTDNLVTLVVSSGRREPHGRLLVTGAGPAEELRRHVLIIYVPRTDRQVERSLAALGANAEFQLDPGTWTVAIFKTDGAGHTLGPGRTHRTVTIRAGETKSVHYTFDDGEPTLE